METYRNVYQLQPKGMAHEVVCQHRSALQARVCPSAPIRVGYVELRYGNGVDFVGRFRYCALHRLLVFVGEYRGHCKVWSLLVGLEMSRVTKRAKCDCAHRRLESLFWSAVARGSQLVEHLSIGEN